MNMTPGRIGLPPNSATHISAGDLVRWVSLLCFIGTFFGNSLFRLDGSVLESGLRLIRGALYVLGTWLVWPIVVDGLLLNACTQANAPPTAVQLRRSWTLFMYLAFIGLEAIVSPAPEVATLRITTFGTYVLPAMLAVVLLADRRGVLMLRNVLVWMGAITICFLFLRGTGVFVSIYGQGSSMGLSDRLVVESDTITTASDFLIYAIAAILVAMTPQTSWYKRLGALGVAIVLLFSALFTGSRGPVLSFLVTCMALAVVGLRGTARRVSFLLFLSAAVVVGFAVLQSVAPGIAERFGMDSPARNWFYNIALRTPPTLFGHGVGNFYRLSPLLQVGDYVHNSMLEAYVETGLVGLVAFVAVIAHAFITLVRFYTSTKESAALFCLAGLTFYFVESQFSGNLFSGKGLYVFLVLGLWLPAMRSIQPKRETTQPGTV